MLGDTYTHTHTYLEWRFIPRPDRSFKQNGRMIGAWDELFGKNMPAVYWANKPDFVGGNYWIPFECSMLLLRVRARTILNLHEGICWFLELINWIGSIKAMEAYRTLNLRELSPWLGWAVITFFFGGLIMPRSAQWAMAGHKIAQRPVNGSHFCCHCACIIISWEDPAW